MFYVGVLLTKEVMIVLFNVKGDLNFKFYILNGTLFSSFFFSKVSFWKTVSELEWTDIKFCKLRKVEELNTEKITWKSRPPSPFKVSIPWFTANFKNFLWGLNLGLAPSHHALFGVFLERLPLNKTIDDSTSKRSAFYLRLVYSTIK